MKTITIHDTNILIDLTDLNLLSVFFKLNFEFHTTDFVLDEIEHAFQKVMVKRFKSNFIIRGFAATELLILLNVQNIYRALSIEDVSVMELSTELNGILCTGDTRLRAIAETRGLEVHGILWIIDQMVEQGVLEPKLAVGHLGNLKSINTRINNELIDREIEKLNQLI